MKFNHDVCNKRKVLPAKSKSSLNNPTQHNNNLDIEISSDSSSDEELQCLDDEPRLKKQKISHKLSSSINYLSRSDYRTEIYLQKYANGKGPTNSKFTPNPWFTDPKFTDQSSKSITRVTRTSTPTDVTLKIQSTFFKVQKVLLATIPLHRCLLSRTSEYFQTLFAGKWKESKSNEITLEIPGLNDLGITRTLLESYIATFFEIFYFKSVRLKESNMFVMHRLSEFFLIKESTRSKIQKFLIDKVTPENYKTFMKFDSTLVDRNLFLFQKLQDEEDFSELGLRCQFCEERISFSDNYGLHTTLKILLCKNCNKYHLRGNLNKRHSADTELVKNSCGTCNKACSYNQVFTKSLEKLKKLQNLQNGYSKWQTSSPKTLVNENSGIYRVVCVKCKRKCCVKCQEIFGVGVHDTRESAVIFTCIECTQWEHWPMWWPKYVDALRLGKIYLLRIFSESVLVKREQLVTLAQVYFDRFMEQQSSRKLNELARGFVEVISLDDEVEGDFGGGSIANEVGKTEKMPN